MDRRVRHAIGSGQTSNSSHTRHTQTQSAQTSGEREEETVEATSTMLDSRIPLQRNPYTGKIADHSKMSRVITSSFHQIQNNTGFNWKRTPVEVKELYYEEFRKSFSWPPEWENDVKKAWGQRAGRRYSDYISEVKDRYNKGQPRPIYVPQEMWAGLILYWQDPNTVKRSIIASKARRSEPDGPGTGMRTHLGGSTSVTEKSLRMAAERGVSLKDVAYAGFKSLHTYKDGTYTCKKAADVDAKVQAIAATKGENPNLSDIFINDVCGGKLDKKKRMFGIGNLASNLVFYTSTESARAQTLRDELRDELRAELRAELRGEIREEIREEIRGEFRQDLDAQSVKISAMEEKMNRILMSQQSNFSRLIDDDASQT